MLSSIDPFDLKTGLVNLRIGESYEIVEYVAKHLPHLLSLANLLRTGEELGILVGPVGPVGPQGEAGPALTITGAVATPGELPAVGKPEEAYLVGHNLYTWSANTNAYQDRGSLQGTQGSQGPQGLKGDKGDVGPQGPRGYQGVSGPEGPMGPAGPVGTSGPIGLPGLTGPAGPNGEPGSNGAPGPAATSAYLTNEAVQLFAYANGNVASYTGATGSFKVFAGTTDISASFSLSSQSNPQVLTIGYSGQTYTVTAGFDDGEDTASVTIRATGSGAYAGVTFDKVFSLSKAKGGYEIVGSLPSTNLFSGRVVFNEADDKIYRYTGTAWTAAVPAADVAGQLIDTQIQAVSASKIAGLLANSQIEAVAAAKVTGQLSDAQLAAISAAKLTGQIVGTQITDGSVTTAKVAAGAITAGQIAADTITAANIAAGAVTASELAAGSVIAGKVAAGAISATELAANSVVAGKIAANAVSANEIAANAVRVQHLLVAPNNISPDPLFRDEAFWVPQESPGWYFEDAPGSATAITLGYRKYMVLWSGVYAGTSRRHVYSQSVPFSGRGQKLRLRARTNNTSNQDLWVFVEFIDATGGYLGGTYPSTAAGSGASTLSHIFDVPDGVALIRFGFCNSAPGSAFSGVLAVTDLKVDVAADASLIVDGSIIAGKIAANAVTANTIEAGAVTAAKIGVTQLSAISATIGLLRTATSGQRLEIENNQIRVYDSSNVLRMRMGVW